MQTVTNLGFTTQNNKWETLTGLELAKYDLITHIYIRKGECDWDPLLGTNIIDYIFQPKTDAIKSMIQEEIKSLFDNDLRLSLTDMETQDVEDGWIFFCNVSYLGGTPETWILNINQKEFSKYSKGYYDLTDEE